MNERIRELAKQAGAIEAKHITNIPSVLSLNGEEIEKFAELIVRECIQSIQNESMNSGDEWEAGLRIAENAVRKHFGVEE